MAFESVKISTDLLAENNKDSWKKYVCPKCDGILQDAVQSSCGHWLCASCAEEIFNLKSVHINWAHLPLFFFFSIIIGIKEHCIVQDLTVERSLLMNMENQYVN